MANNYDHREKAGNASDVVKHVAEIAALESVIETRLDKKSGPLLYCDPYAGFAETPLGHYGGWRSGVGRLATSRPVSWAGAWWHRRYATGLAPDSVYPGSVRIAIDLASELACPIRVCAWDTDEDAVATLRRLLSGRHDVFQRAADPNGDDGDLLESADFTLIDPPDGKPSTWKRVQKLLRAAPDANVLVWLPVGAKCKKGERPRLSEQQAEQRRDALKLKLHVTRVRFRPGVQTVGCALAYRLPRRGLWELRRAVGEVAHLAGWIEVKHFDP